MFALLLVGLSAGLSNLTGAIAIGVSGVNAGVRLRVGLVFGLFESLMPVAGLLVGRSLASDIGRAGGPGGGALLIIVGAYTIVTAWRSDNDQENGLPLGQSGMPRLLALGAVLSIDNLVIGFALGPYHVGLLAAAVTIGTISVSLSLVGLEFGSLLGTRIGEFSEYIAGVLLIGVGIALGVGVL
jgi:manganese efflux pump family protein